MIHLITGTPGAGKTVRAVQMTLGMMSGEDTQDRLVFSNVNGFKRAEDIPDPWTDVPDGSIVVIDEVQQRWRRYNPNGKPPEEIAALETHRHRGIDFILTCQNAKQLSNDVRSLVDVHEHIWRPGKTKRALVIRFDGEVSTNPMRDRSRPEVEVSPFKLPADVFSEYTSASVHTDRARIPRIVYVAATVGVLGIGMIAYTGYHFSTAWGTVQAADETPASQSRPMESRQLASLEGSIIQPEPQTVEAFGYMASEARGTCMLVDERGRAIDTNLADCLNASRKPFPQPVQAR